MLGLPAVLILLFGPVSGAHLNPRCLSLSISCWVDETSSGPARLSVVAYSAAQIACGENRRRGAGQCDV